MNIVVERKLVSTNEFGSIYSVHYCYKNRYMCQSSWATAFSLSMDDPSKRVLYLPNKQSSHTTAQQRVFAKRFASKLDID